MQFKIEILKKGTKGKKGDKVLNVWDNKIAISKASGEVEIFTIDFDKETEMPFISDDSLLITINPYSEYGAAHTDNIITLCPECHRRYHSGDLDIDIFRF